MALQIVHDDVYGVNHPEAYARIQQVIVENKPIGGKNVQTEVWVYASKVARDTGKSPVWGRTYRVEDVAKVQSVEEGAPVVMKCAVDPDTVTVADCYNWLKTQDKYAEGKDV